MIEAVCICAFCNTCSMKLHWFCTPQVSFDQNVKLPSYFVASPDVNCSEWYGSAQSPRSLPYATEDFMYLSKFRAEIVVVWR